MSAPVSRIRTPHRGRRAMTRPTRVELSMEQAAWLRIRRDLAEQAWLELPITTMLAAANVRAFTKGQR